MEKNTAFLERVQGRLDRLDLSAEDASRAAGLPSLFIGQVARGDIAPPRGKRLIQLAEILSTEVAPISWTVCGLGDYAFASAVSMLAS
jgi:hypothetical protein